MEPVVFKLVEIDHIIPETLEGNAEKLESLKIAFGLDENFQINSYLNWLPSCSRCNKSKGSKVFDPSPVYLSLFQTAASKAGKAQQKAKRFESDKGFGAKIEALIEAGQQAGAFPKEFWEEIKAAGDRFYIDEPRQSIPQEIPVTAEVSLSLTSQGVEILRNWMSFGARTALPTPDTYFIQIKTAMHNIAATKQVELPKNPLHATSTLIKEGLVDQDQMTFLVRAIHAIKVCEGKTVAELTDQELFAAQSHAIQALDSLRSIPESGVHAYL